MRSALQHLANIAIILVMGIAYVVALLVGTGLKHVTELVAKPMKRAVGFISRQAGIRRATS